MKPNRRSTAFSHAGIIHRPSDLHEAGNRGEIRKLIRGVTRASDHDATPRASRSPLCRSFVALERLGHSADDPTPERPIH